MTIQLQTSGISFLQPRVAGLQSELQAAGRGPVHERSGDVVTVHLPSVNPFQHVLYRGRQPATDVFGIGRYALSVTYDNRSLVNPASLPAILRGPYDSLSAGDLAGLLSGADDVLFQNNLLTELHVPDGRAAVEPARLSGEHAV